MTRFQRLRSVAAGAVTAVMAACAVGAMAASAGGLPARRRCYPPGSTTIAQDKTGRFFHIGSSSIRGRWYVCAFKQGTPRRLPYALPNLPSSSAKVAGRYVAFFVFFAGRGPSRGPVTVFDMVTGHRTFSSKSTGYAYGSLVLKGNGSVAWIASVPGVVANPQPWEVSRRDSTGTATVDSGPGIERYSLAAGGSWLYWTNAGSPRSAAFH